MRNRSNTIAYIIFGLIAIGVLASLFTSPRAFLVPLLVFGAIFLLYKFPPNTWNRQSRKPPSGRFAKGKRKNANFRVIPGSKDKQDEPPKYH
ncbi:hypothetical protein SAMN02799630_03455 [Paenibacillus sp. UNCCL117]|uniref:hypothetical protein n=1 Tax=unclassified Paenibacillus TaxID=185978 RepID=UPI00088303BA|nr:MULTISPECIES: hypothetical protein [unclassified Paenibacillus]SDD43127.1 hypothetical protein SAMN04488602_108164 [Paenibacillus sp. cl123]SFW47449.1 hypothetical protein SAMN02799630_03455 [Paenibacillus sp. UNCCL117]